MTTKSSFAITKRFALLAVALLAVFVGTGMFRANNAEAATTIVNVGQANLYSGSATRYNSPVITIAQGDTVTWNWTGNGHNVRSTTGLFEFPAGAFAFDTTVDIGATFSRVFNTPGTYYYYCTPHSSVAAAIDANLTPTNSTMAGRIVVTAPVDAAAPVVSGVAVSPSPSNGAGAVTLSASATDQTGISKFEYQIDALAIVTVTQSGLSLSTSIATGGLALGNHTVKVRATDSMVAPGPYTSAWSASVTFEVSATPAGSKPATVTIAAGALTNETSGVVLSGITLGGANTESSGAPATPWVATDARGSGAGWNVTISSSSFAGSAGGSIPYTNFKIALAQGAITSSVGATAPPTTGAATATAFSATPLTLLTATGPAGMGAYNYTPNFVLTVPASATPGLYTANMTISINSGP